MGPGFLALLFMDSGVPGSLVFGCWGSCVFVTLYLAVYVCGLLSLCAPRPLYCWVSLFLFLCASGHLRLFIRLSMGLWFSGSLVPGFLGVFFFLGLWVPGVSVLLCLWISGFLNSWFSGTLSKFLGLLNPGFLDFWVHGFGVGEFLALGFCALVLRGFGSYVPGSIGL